MSDNFSQDYAYYQGVLVLPKDFDEALLKKAYRREAMKWHPDKNPDDVYAWKMRGFVSCVQVIADVFHGS